jgi:hypothetical protein
VWEQDGRKRVGLTALSDGSGLRLCGALLGGGLPALDCAQEDAARSRIARSTALGSVVSKSISLAHSGVIAMRAICR